MCEVLIKKNILFLCVANSARSQIAEGLAKQILGSTVNIESAGSKPSEKVQPWAIKVLNEIGINILQNKPKSTDDIDPEFYLNLEYIITLCAEEVCPVIPTKAKRLHWPIKDPAMASEDLKPDAFRVAREQITEKLLELKKELGL